MFQIFIFCEFSLASFKLLLLFPWPAFVLKLLFLIVTFTCYGYYCCSCVMSLFFYQLFNFWESSPTFFSFPKYILCCFHALFSIFLSILFHTLIAKTMFTQNSLVLYLFFASQNDGVIPESPDMLTLQSLSRLYIQQHTQTAINANVLHLENR